MAIEEKTLARLTQIAQETARLQSQIHKLDMESLSLVEPYLYDREVCEKLLDVLGEGYVRYKVRYAMWVKE